MITNHINSSLCVGAFVDFQFFNIFHRIQGYGIYLYKSPSPTFPSHSDCNPITVLTQDSASLEETCAHITINERATTTFISVIQHVCKGYTTVCIQLNFEKKLVFVWEHDVKICTSFKIFQYYHILSAKATKSLGLTFRIFWNCNWVKHCNISLF